MLNTILAQSAIIQAIADEMDNIALGALILLIVLVISINATIRKIAVERAREQTRRELAAYIAEGSVKPEDAIGLLNAGREMDTKEAIATSAAEGWISAKKADQLIQALDRQHAAKA